MFKAATVVAKKPFSASVGERLGTALLEELGQPPSACWLLTAPSHELKELLQGVVRSLGTDNLVGCTTDGEISTMGLSTGSAVLCGVATDQVEFHFAAAHGLGKDSEGAGKNLGEQFPSTISCVHMFSDGLTGNGCAILRGLGSAIGARVPVVGGTSGDAGEFRKTWQFLGSEVLTDSVVAVGFSGDLAVGTGVRSGWSPIGIAKKVTKARGNVIY